MAKTILRFPYKGLSKNAPFHSQPDLTTQRATNVRPEGTLDDKYRGSQRAGLTDTGVLLKTTESIQYMMETGESAPDASVSDLSQQSYSFFACWKEDELSVRVVEWKHGEVIRNVVVASVPGHNITFDYFTDSYTASNCLIKRVPDGSFYLIREDVLYKLDEDFVVQSSVTIAVGYPALPTAIDNPDWYPFFGVRHMEYNPNSDTMAIYAMPLNGSGVVIGSRDNFQIIDCSTMAITASTNIERGTYQAAEADYYDDNLLQSAVVQFTGDGKFLVFTGSTTCTTYGGLTAQPAVAALLIDGTGAITDSLTVAASPWSIFKPSTIMKNGDVFLPATNYKLYVYTSGTLTLKQETSIPNYRFTAHMGKAYTHTQQGEASRDASDEWVFDNWVAAETTSSGCPMVRFNVKMGYDDAYERFSVAGNYKANGGYRLWKYAADGTASDLYELSIIPALYVGAFYGSYGGEYEPGLVPPTEDEVWPTVESSIPVIAKGIVTVTDGSIRGEDGLVVTGGTDVLSDQPCAVAGAWAFSNGYFVDGTDNKILVRLLSSVDPWNTNYGKVIDWDTEVTAHGYGTLPEACRLVALYRGRVILAANPDEPFNWFMSASGAGQGLAAYGLDWDYDPSTTTAIQAVAGNNSDAGELGDALTALIPYSDDVLIMGGSNSVYMLSGDPAAGGSIDLITDKVGIQFGSAWAMDSTGMIYFMGTDGIYMMPVGSREFKNLTRGRLDGEWDGVDWSKVRCRMQWDTKRDCLYVLITVLYWDEAVTLSEDTSRMWTWHKKTDSWWTDSYDDNIGPSSMIELKSENPREAGVHFGGYDGLLYRVDDYAETDGAYPVMAGYSSIIGGGASVDLVASNFRAVMDAESADTEITVLSGRTHEEAWGDDAVTRFVKPVAAGRNRADRRIARGAAIRVDVGKSDGSDGRWSVESIEADVETCGTPRGGMV